jgi:hypothetical protein
MLKNIRQMSVYVTYSDAYEASLAIIVIYLIIIIKILVNK